jgi:hypothetical protein
MPFARVGRFDGEYLAGMASLEFAAVPMATAKSAAAIAGPVIAAPVDAIAVAVAHLLTKVLAPEFAAVPKKFAHIAISLVCPLPISIVACGKVSVNGMRPTIVVR